MKDINIKRCLAAYIDYIVIIFSCSLLALVISFGKMDTKPITVCVFFVAFFFFVIFKDYAFKDASIGKKILKIKLVNKNFEPPNFEERFFRTITLVLFPLEIMMMLFNNERLGDLLVKTKVVEIDNITIEGDSMFKEINAREIDGNLIKAIADEWMLISAGDSVSYNMMTASWGFAGEMWGNDSVVAMIRPQRYTMDFVDNSDYFTLSFYGENKGIHKVCGSKSGRDVDKTALTGLTPVFADNTVYFEEARLVLVCKKQYVGRLMEENFTDKEPLKWYAEKDYHYMIIGKIEKVLVK